MTVKDYINKIFPWRSKQLKKEGEMIFGVCKGWGEIDHRPYAEAVWLSVCDLLCDLAENFQITERAGAYPDHFGEGFQLFAAFKAFFYTWGRIVWQRLFNDGYVVIGFNGNVFRPLSASEYLTVQGPNETTEIKPKVSGMQVYVMRSTSYIVTGQSDHALVNAWLQYLNDVLDASATISQRLGAVVIASPKDPAGATFASVLEPEVKKDLEKDLREGYGALSKQSNILLTPQPMDFQTINLAGLDLRTQEKVKTCVLVLCDRVKVPANQVALIDAASSKTLANGSELREGDRLKYKSARRLFESTFVQMANELGVAMEYIIDGEPKLETGGQMVETQTNNN